MAASAVSCLHMFGVDIDRLILAVLGWAEAVSSSASRFKASLWALEGRSSSLEPPGLVTSCEGSGEELRLSDAVEISIALIFKILHKNS